jgi:zinc protease
MSLKARVAAALLLTTLWFGPALAQPKTIIRPPGIPDSEIVQFDPRAVIGVLPNGVHYGVMRRPGTRDLSLLLYIKAGSADETPSERGIAHFLEHMAFNGSKNFPANSVIQSFENIGVALGRDQNAQTEFGATTYELDLSEITSDKVDLALKWLRDVADGLTLDQSEVDRERGAIMSEYRSIQSANAQTEHKSVAFLAEGLLGPKRDPIGEPATISAINAKMLRSFYQKWYRPESATVVLVGDAPVQVLKARVEAAFGSWRNDTPKPPDPDLGVVEPRKLDVLALTDPHAASGITVCRVIDKPPVEIEDVNTHQREFIEATWTEALQRRLSRLAQSATPAIAAAGVNRSDEFDRASYACVDATERDQDWQDAVRAIAVETRRMELHGITEDELRRAKAEFRARLDGTVGSVDTMTSRRVAQLILLNLSTGGTYDTAEEDRRVGLMGMDRTTKDVVDKAFRAAWTAGAGPLIVSMGPTPVSADAIKQVWNEAMAAPPPGPPAAQTGHPWAYSDLGPVGQVVHREVLPDIDTTRIEFANGVRVNFKQTENAADQVSIRIRFGAGQKEIPQKDVFTANIAAKLLRLGALGKNDLEDVERLCEGHSCSMEFAVGRDSFILAAAARPSDLNVELQLLTAYLVDPGFRPEIDVRWRTIINDYYQQSAAEPASVANQAIGELMKKPHIFDIPPREAALSVTAADMARMLGPSLKTDALDVTIIGDVDEATATAALAKTLGAIPRRERRDTALPNAPVVRFPSPAPIVRLTHEGSPDKALVMVVWPLFVATPDNVREQRVTELLGSIMGERMLDTIRHNEGNTYTPSVGVSLDHGGDQGAMTASIETAPSTADAVVADARQIAADLAAGKISDADFERVRRPVLDAGATRELGNEWWLTMLDGSWAHPDQIAAAKTWESDMTTISLDEIKAEAARWLKKPPVVIVVTPKAAPPKP